LRLCGFAALREAPLTFNGHFYSKVPEQLPKFLKKYLFRFVVIGVESPMTRIV